MIGKRRQVRGRLGITKTCERRNCSCCFFLCLVGFVCRWLIMLIFCESREQSYYAGFDDGTDSKVPLLLFLDMVTANQRAEQWLVGEILMVQRLGSLVRL